MTATTAQIRQAVEAIRSDAVGQCNEKLANLVLAGMELAMDAVDDGKPVNAAMLGQIVAGAKALDGLIDVASENDPLTVLRAI